MHRRKHPKMKTPILILLSLSLLFSSCNQAETRIQKSTSPSADKESASMPISSDAGNGTPESSASEPPSNVDPLKGLSKEEVAIINQLNQDVASADKGIKRESAIHAANAELIARTGTDEYLINKCLFRVKSSYRNEESFRLTWGPVVDRSFDNSPDLATKYDALVVGGASGTNAYGARLTSDFSCSFKNQVLINVFDHD